MTQDILPNERDLISLDGFDAILDVCLDRMDLANHPTADQCYSTAAENHHASTLPVDFAEVNRG